MWQAVGFWALGSIVLTVTALALWRMWWRANNWN
jgi:hypothetical protein